MLMTFDGIILGCAKQEHTDRADIHNDERTN